jgi:outer membrane receptor for ferrienterochelin and colicins
VKNLGLPFTLLVSLTLTGALAQTEPDTIAGRQLDEVVITGQFEPQSMKKSVYQVRAIDKEIIQLRNPTSLQTLLNTELGIRFTEDPVLGVADISLNGMSGQNVKILLDGVPMLDRGATRESLNQIDVNTIERIEIVEGPMSVTYGTDALAGVINIITKKSLADDGNLSIAARVLEETVGEEYSAFSGLGRHNENVNVDWHKGRLFANAGVTRNVFGGFNQGVIEEAWKPKDQYLGNAGFGFKNSNVDVWYRLNYVFENIKSPGEIINNSRTDQEYITNRFTHQSQGDWKVNDRLSFNAILSHQDYRRRTRTTITDVITGDRRLSPHAGTQDKSQFTSEVIRLISLYRFSPKLSLQSGTDINLNKGFGERIEGTQTIHDFAVFVSSEIEATKKLSVRPGLRFIYNTKYNAPPAIPSLNTKWKFTDRLDLRFAYARGFRAPALRELYFTFFDASHSIRGNPNLKAEFSHSFTGSLDWQMIKRQNTALKTTLGGFFSTFDNLIDFALDPSDPTQTITTYINVYKYETKGVNLNTAYLWKNVQANLGMLYIGVYNLYSDDDGALPQILYTPEVNSTVTYRFPRLGASASVFYKYTGARSRYSASFDQQTAEQIIQLIKVEAYSWFDATLSKSIGKYVTVNGGVKNVFDVARLRSNAVAGGAHSAGSSVPTSYGRSYFLGLNVSWNKTQTDL